ncbi:WD40 repeat domain-containing protein [Actinoplanes sp. DH11]|uniref:WD40 repeat domain-containing protein n=1 Tax=Actinoplanes sp. DH11 TaxID=2857011 RepID=UPI001E4B6D04|nr:hypothetical protein [Actinoplanes sp. DH11]
MRKKILTWSAVAVVVAALVVAGATRPWRDAPGDAVPGGLELPWMWQATVDMDPPGRASVLVGGDSIGFRGTDIFDSEGKIAVVGRAGDYRMLLHGGWDSVAAGADVLLSPDGLRVARSAVDTEGLEIIDLTTGKSRIHPVELSSAGPIAWAPDGRSVLTSVYVGANSENVQFVLIDLDTGGRRLIGEEIPDWSVRSASRGAFAPDGRHLAITSGETLRLMDRTGATVWTAQLGDRAHLAGTGAFTPDGTRIAIARLDGCVQDCDETALAARRWTVGYLDAATGAPATGPELPAVTGMAIRALGWSQGRDLVVVRHLPEKDAYREAQSDATPGFWNDTGWYETGDIALLGLSPGGGTRTLLDPPGDVLTIDVAADLLQAGRFGGATPAANPFPARPIIVWAVVPLICLGIVFVPLIFAAVATVRRRRRSSAPAGPPSKPGPTPA